MAVQAAGTELDEPLLITKQTRDKQRVTIILYGVIRKKIRHIRPFILWLIGFWNGLVDTYLVEKSIRSRGWEAVQKSLIEHEDTVRTLVRCVPTEASCTPGTPRAARKARSKAIPQLVDDGECGTSNKRSPGDKISLKQQPATGETSARGRPKRGRLSLNKSSLAGQQTTPVKRSRKSIVSSILHIYHFDKTMVGGCLACSHLFDIDGCLTG
ncbi:hypothetical protein AHF37_02415 [Paragonimus kellicotti]|nr:hypothetical protein AHF37_02415 [Paragonimus kellicotti]